MIITIGAGLNSGVRSGWTAQLRCGDRDEPPPGGEVTIVRIDKTTRIPVSSVSI